MCLLIFAKVMIFPISSCCGDGSLPLPVEGTSGRYASRYGDALMSEHFLYGAQIGAALEKMRGKGMTEGVRTDVFLYAALAAEFLYDVEYHCAG